MSVAPADVINIAPELAPLQSSEIQTAINDALLEIDPTVWSGGAAASNLTTVPNWQPGTQYFYGVVVQNAGGAYQQQQIPSGVSGTGSGPVGNTASYTEGTCNWKYVGSSVATTGSVDLATKYLAAHKLGCSHPELVQINPRSYEKSGNKDDAEYATTRFGMEYRRMLKRVDAHVWGC